MNPRIVAARCAAAGCQPSGHACGAGVRRQGACPAATGRETGNPPRERWNLLPLGRGRSQGGVQDSRAGTPPDQGATAIHTSPSKTQPPEGGSMSVLGSCSVLTSKG